MKIDLTTEQVSRLEKVLGITCSCSSYLGEKYCVFHSGGLFVERVEQMARVDERDDLRRQITNLQEDVRQAREDCEAIKREKSQAAEVVADRDLKIADLSTRLESMKIAAAAACPVIKAVLK